MERRDLIGLDRRAPPALYPPGVSAPGGFDPEQLEQQLVALGQLKPRIESDHGALGENERFFTEDNHRFFALWRITMVRQIHPEILRRLPNDDLLFIAAETAEGYEPQTQWGIDLVRNKLEQNALRARVEIDRRARRAAFAQSLIVGALSALIGATVGVALGAWLA
jgi:hypothetical protein